MTTLYFLSFISLDRQFWFEACSTLRYILTHLLLLYDSHLKIFGADKGYGKWIRPSL